MPVHVLLEGTGPQIPAHLTRIPISLITTSTDVTDKIVKGKVVHKGPLVPLNNDSFILKMVIQEEDSMLNSSSQNSSVNVVLFGSLAKNFSQSANQGVLRPVLPNPRSPPANERRSPVSAELSSAKAPKYTYAKLDSLKAGSVVNVYGVVVFFKQPFKSRGTDFCSSLKITDHSNEKIGCTIFCEKLEDHPKIFRNGDIVRMHRVKAQVFNKSITLVNTFGFSVVTFDGVKGAPVEPRTSSRSFHFDPDDQRTVEELRSWAASQALFASVTSTVPLSAVQPKAYFDLTCQLLAKAPVDTTCTLLRVWDGTRCPHTLLKVIVEPHVTEGQLSFSKERENLIADVLVYDNHVEVARKLKPGVFLRIYNLRAIAGSSTVPGLTRSQLQVDHLAFHLHGGTSYGRGIGILPDNSPDVQELKRVIEAFQENDEEALSELNDSDLLEVWRTPPESLDGETLDCSTERSCSHDMQKVTLSEVKRSGLGRVHHVRAQLKAYEPHRLHEALKLYCSKCKSMQDVPDDELLESIFSEASKDCGPCSPPPWVLSGQVSLPRHAPGPSNRALTVYLLTQLMFEGKTKDVILLMGSTLEEMCQLMASYQNIIPVRASGGHLSLFDLSAPFLFRGRKRYYGSEITLGIQPLQFILLMKLELQDATDTLDVFLWRHAESFFGVSAEDASANQEAQNSICQIMDSLCPPGGNVGQHPWLDLCLMAYQAEDDDGQTKTCYQVCHTTVVKPSSE
ncbi:protection of telomeres protein 1 [Pundamilia nyererei]|uniref:Protection of telomeres protein 1 n=1 Tax=Pundamilia nyererei TaxID=303518 RepID=A0A9Y3VTS3_9CICH|nr:PREDICTED: protection of telomeres protein 1 [Pundamilia nyererei]